MKRVLWVVEERQRGYGGWDSYIGYPTKKSAVAYKKSLDIKYPESEWRVVKYIPEPKS